MAALPIAEFREIALRRDADGRPVFMAEGGVDVPGLTELSVAFGYGGSGTEVMPPSLRDLATLAPQVATIDQRLADGGTVWIRVSDATPAPHRTAWLATFDTRLAVLIGTVRLTTPPVAVPGLRFDTDTTLTVALQVSGDGVTIDRAHFALTAKAGLDAGFALGPLQLGDVDFDFELTFEAELLPPLSELLDAPERALEGGFAGSFSLRSDTRGGALFGMVGDHAFELAAAATSPAGSTELSLDELRLLVSFESTQELHHGLGVDALTFALTGELQNLTSDGDSSAGSLRMDGAGLVEFSPTALWTNGGTAEARIGYRHTAADGHRLRLSFASGGPTPAEDVLPFDVPAADLAVEIRRAPGADWSAGLHARFVAPWASFATWVAAGAALVPGSAGPGLIDWTMPDVLLELTAGVRSGHVEAALLARLVAPAPPGSWPPDAAPVDRYESYAGPLGPAPLDVADAHLRLRFDSSASPALTGSGSARLSTVWDRIGAAAVLPALTDTTAEWSLGDELRLVVSGGIPPLCIPTVGDAAPITILQPTSLECVLGDRLAVRLAVALPAVGDESLFDALRAAFGIPEFWETTLDALQTACSGVIGEVAVEVPLERSADSGIRVRVRLAAGQRSWLDLFRTLQGIAADVSHASPAPADPTEAPRDGALHDRTATRELDHAAGAGPFSMAPDALEIDIVLGGGEPRVELAASILCRALGEQFDARLAFELSGEGGTLRLAAGVQDPIRIAIPSPAPVDWPAIVTAFEQAVGDLDIDGATFLTSVFGAPDEPFMVFELRDVGISISLGADGFDIGTSGGIRIVQFPGLLDDVLPLPGPTAVLGATATGIHIELQPPFVTDLAAVKPLLSIPIAPKGMRSLSGDTFPRDQSLDLYFGGFALGYSWAPSSVTFRLKAGVGVPEALLDATDYLPLTLRVPDGSGGAPSVWLDVELRQLTAKAPPIVLFSLKFGDTAAPHGSNRGLEFVLQVPDWTGSPDQPQQLAVGYLRELSLVPMTQMLDSAVVLDWGSEIGPREAPFLALRFRGITIQAIKAPLIVLFPWAWTVPPSLPLPPFSFLGIVSLWPSFAIPMFDVYTGWPLPTADGIDHGIQIEARIPAVVDVELGLSRPMPSLPIPAVFELAALGQKLLAGELDSIEIPEHAALRDIAFVVADYRIDLPILDALVADRSAFGLPFEDDGALRLDIGDALQALLPLLERFVGFFATARDTLATAAGDAMAQAEAVRSAVLDRILELDRRQAELVALVPLHLRRVQASVALNVPILAELACTVTAALLTPDELHRELRLYHEGLLPRPSRPTDVADPAARPGAGGGAPPSPADPAIDRETWQLRWEVELIDTRIPAERARRLFATATVRQTVDDAVQRAVRAELASLARIRSPELRRVAARLYGVDARREPGLRGWIAGGGRFPRALFERSLRSAFERERPIQAAYRRPFVARLDEIVDELVRHTRSVRRERLQTLRAAPDLRAAVATVVEPGDVDRVARAAAALLRELPLDRPLTSRAADRQLEHFAAGLGAVLPSAARPRILPQRAAAALLRREPVELVLVERIADRRLRRQALQRLGVLDGLDRRSHVELLRAVERCVASLPAEQRLAVAAFREVDVRMRAELRVALRRFATLVKASGAGLRDAERAQRSAFAELVGYRDGRRKSVRRETTIEIVRADATLATQAWTTLLGDHRVERPPAAAPATSLERAAAYVLRCRTAGEALLPASVFAVPVAGSSPAFAVVHGGGRYRLRLLRTIGAERVVADEIALPAAVTSLEPDTPGKAERLRARLVVREDRVETPFRELGVDPQPAQPAFLHGADHHRRSLFWTGGQPWSVTPPAAPSELFQLALPAAGETLPGSHGRLNVADLLVVRHDDGSVDYLGTDRPVLVAGVRASLWTGLGGLAAGVDVNLCGLVIQSDQPSPGAELLTGVATPVPGPSLLFSARVDQLLEFGTGPTDLVQLRLDGELRYLAGSAWSEGQVAAALAALSAGDDLGLEPDALRFRGAVALTVGDVTVEGAARGTLTSGGFDLTITTVLKLALALDGDPGSVPAGLLPDGDVSGLTLTATASGDATLTARLDATGLEVALHAPDDPQEGARFAGHVTVEFDLLKSVPKAVGQTCTWVLELFEAAAGIVEAALDLAIQAASALLGEAEDDEVPIGSGLGRFRRVCHTVEEVTQALVPHKLQVPGEDEDAEVRIGGRLRTGALSATSFWLEVVVDGARWRVLTVDGLPDWFLPAP
ncbi:MAG: hypothetical protein IPM29_07660 [Planctomycetes bacterium]|nr:hypothetical protein [Planctomycetota bacterium]